MAKRPMSPATAFTDVFRDWQRVYTRRNVGLVREFPSIPTRPRMRVSPADLSYDVPPEVDLRAFATDERIDVDIPYFVLPEDRRIRRGYFPLLLRLHSGVLLAVWREASSHSYCPFGRTVAAQSVNGGQSWSQPWVVEFKLPGAWEYRRPGEDLSTLAAQAVRLRAELSTADRGHTPTLWSWSMDCEAIHK